MLLWQLAGFNGLPYSERLKHTNLMTRCSDKKQQTPGKILVIQAKVVHPTARQKQYSLKLIYLQ